MRIPMETVQLATRVQTIEINSIIYFYCFSPTLSPLSSANHEPNENPPQRRQRKLS